MVTLLNTVEDVVAKSIARDYNDAPEALLEILHAIQAQSGYLSDAALRTVAHSLNISRAEIHGVASFYHDYKRKAGAKKTIKICRAEACQAVGVQALIEQIETTLGLTLDGENAAQESSNQAPSNEKWALEATYCLGNCALGPAVLIDDKLYGRVDLAKLQAVMDI